MPSRSAQRLPTAAKIEGTRPVDCPRSALRAIQHPTSHERRTYRRLRRSSRPSLIAFMVIVTLSQAGCLKQVQKTRYETARVQPWYTSAHAVEYSARLQGAPSSPEQIRQCTSKGSQCGSILVLRRSCLVRALNHGTRVDRIQTVVVDKPKLRALTFSSIAAIAAGVAGLFVQKSTDLDPHLRRGEDVNNNMRLAFPVGSLLYGASMGIYAAVVHSKTYSKRTLGERKTYGSKEASRACGAWRGLPSTYLNVESAAATMSLPCRTDINGRCPLPRDWMTNPSKLRASMPRFIRLRNRPRLPITDARAQVLGTLRAMAQMSVPPPPPPPIGGNSTGNTPRSAATSAPPAKSEASVKSTIAPPQPPGSTRPIGRYRRPGSCAGPPDQERPHCVQFYRQACERRNHIKGCRHAIYETLMLPHKRAVKHICRLGRRQRQCKKIANCEKAKLAFHGFVVAYLKSKRYCEEETRILGQRGTLCGKLDQVQTKFVEPWRQAIDQHCD